jgi:hypothetical protein
MVLPVMAIITYATLTAGAGYVTILMALPALNPPCRNFEAPRVIADGADIPGMLGVFEQAMSGASDVLLPRCEHEPQQMFVTGLCAGLLGLVSVPVLATLILPADEQRVPGRPLSTDGLGGSREREI